MSLRSLRANVRVTSADIERLQSRCFSSGSLEQCPEWQREGRVGSRIPLVKAQSNCFRGLRCVFLFELRKKKNIEKAADRVPQRWVHPRGHMEIQRWPRSRKRVNLVENIREKVNFCLVR